MPRTSHDGRRRRRSLAVPAIMLALLAASSALTACSTVEGDVQTPPVVVPTSPMSQLFYFPNRKVLMPSQ